MRLFTHIILVLALFSFSCVRDDNSTSNSIDIVEQHINAMSVKEKVGQTAQITLDAITVGDNIFSSIEPITVDQKLAHDAFVEYGVGSVLNTANNKALSLDVWNKVISSIQTVSGESAHKVPVIYGVDAIHGATYTAGSTLFPQQIAQGATFNEELVYKIAEITAYETKASGIPWDFSPVLDLGKDPRWARHWEGYGEDPYLISQMGVSAVNGYQGDDLSDKESVAVCLKHFLGYASNSGKDRTPADISNVSLREYHLPAFKAAIDAGAASVMINSGIINGTPVHANYDILTTLLKEELQFDGLVLTDWADIENLHNRDKVAASHKEAIKLAINAGIDMSMIPYDYKRYCDLLIELVNEGEVSMARLDDAVRRVLTLKHKLGLFEQSTFDHKDYAKFGSKEFEQLSYDAASEAITLLKNSNDILPLDKNTKVFVAGPNANSMRTLNGGWSYSWQGEKVELFAQDYNTILESIQNTFGKNNVSYAAGVEYDMKGTYEQETNIDIQAAVRKAKQSDVIVLCLGENTYTEKPGDLHDMMISENQEELALALAKTGKPIVLVLNEGRPRIIRNIEPHVAAVVQTYLSGNFAGDALADILVGKVNPSGRLPYTYPMYSNTLVTYNHKPSEESTTPEGMYDYGGGFFPQYEFAHGLCYTTFEYSNMSISPIDFTGADSLTINVKVKNIGKRAGKEVVLLYSSDIYASVTPDVKRLRRFKKIELLPNEEKVVQFVINASDLSFINKDGKRITEDGEFKLAIDTLETTVVYHQ